MAFQLNIEIVILKFFWNRLVGRDILQFKDKEERKITIYINVPNAKQSIIELEKLILNVSSVANVMGNLSIWEMLVLKKMSIRVD